MGFHEPQGDSRVGQFEILAATAARSTSLEAFFWRASSEDSTVSRTAVAPARLKLAAQEYLVPQAPSIACVRAPACV